MKVVENILDVELNGSAAGQMGLAWILGLAFCLDDLSSIYTIRLWN